MATGPPDRFSNDEKNYLLAEIVKSISPPFTVLLDVCNRMRIEPSWDDIILPPGRTVNACRAAFDEMRRTPLTFSPLSQTPTGPTPLSAPTAPIPRPVEGTYTTGRRILPRQSTYPYAPVVAAEQPLKRKRGRPTKAEAQARAEAASSSAVTEPATPLARMQSASIPASPAIDIRPTASLPPATRGLPISAMITTPVAPKSASHSSSSSGKRRRRRRSEEAMPGASSGLHGPQPAPAYFSPTRQPPGFDETPARTASMRRRDESIHTSVARLGVSEPDPITGRTATTQSGQPPSPRRPPLP